MEDWNLNNNNKYMFKRIILFILTNIAVIFVLTLVFAILENIFGFRFDIYGFNYTSIIIYSLIIWFTWSFISLWMSKWMAKRAYLVVVVSKDQYYGLNQKQKVVWDLIEDLSNRNRIKMPEVGFYESADPNAFTTWSSKNNSLVAVSSWLLDMMNKDAIEWVVAHEMSHILNWDMLTMTLMQWVLNTFVVALSRIISNIIANTLDEDMSEIAYFWIVILLQMIFGIFASLILMKFSRYREYKADAWSAWFVWKEKW